MVDDCAIQMSPDKPHAVTAIARRYGHGRPHDPRTENGNRCHGSGLMRQRFAGFGVEKMDSGQLWDEPDRRTGAGDVTIIGDGADLLVAQHGEDMYLRPRRLEHAHRRWN